MKKKFAAAFVACALAMAMPMTAFAAGSVEADYTVPGQATIGTSDKGNGDMKALQIAGTTANAYANNFGTTIGDSKANASAYALKKGGEAADKAVEDAQKANKAALDDLNNQLNFASTPQERAAIEEKIAEINDKITKAGTDAYKAWQDSEKAYNKTVASFANINGNSVINTFELQGDSMGSMTVTVVLDESKYAGHTVTVIIFNEDGTTTTSTQVVDKNGCIKIQKNGFCVWTLVDCSGGLPAGTKIDNGVSASDFEKALNTLGNATDKGTSPKTGC